MTVRNKVVMIGLDAADIDYIESHLSELPNLARILDRGRYRRIGSTADVMSASVWSTFYTGTMPGEHGYYFPMQWDPADMKLKRVSADWLYCEPFWYELSRAGVNVTSFDVQTEFAGQIANGLEVVNWGAQSFDAFYCSDKDMGRAIRARFGRHPMGPDIPVRKGLRRLERIEKDLLEGVALRGELARWLLRETRWDLFIAVFTECHRGGHNLWPDPEGNGSEVPADGLLSLYKATDDEVGRLIDCVDLRDTSVIVFSLHGMGPNSSQMHLLPRIMDKVNQAFAGTAGSEVPSPGLMRVLRERLPPVVQESVARAVPERVRDWVTTRAFGDSRRQRNEPGFVLPSGTEGSLRYNLEGREHPGVIAPDTELHHRYKKHVRDSLLSFRHPDNGQPAVRDVHYPSQEFEGSRSHYLPDMTFDWTDHAPAHVLESPSLGEIRLGIETGRGGNHRGAAFAAVMGDPAAKGGLPSLEHIVDFSSFVSGLLGDRPN